MSQNDGTTPVHRFHDLDALRAFAMFLGIALHASLSFTGLPWIVQDSHSSSAFGLMIAAVHGFRMQLFMLVSGFFTMMLFRKRGLVSVSVQRIRRVLLPCLLGLVTIVPALDFVSAVAMRSPTSQSPNSLEFDSEPAIYRAIRRGDIESLKKELDAGGDPNQLDKRFRIAMLGWAALEGDVEAARILIDAGAKVDIRSGQGHAPVHQAAFMGHAGVLDLLVQRGADLNARSDTGETAVDSARSEYGAVEYIARILGLKAQEEIELRKGRESCLEILRQHTRESHSSEPTKRLGTLTTARNAYASWIRSDRFLTSITKFGRPIHLFETDIFHHLWFLWFLCWLVTLFILAAYLTNGLPNTAKLWSLFQGRGGFVGLIAVTMIPQIFMGVAAGAALGPDTSTGLLPMPHLLLYYGIFFAYGALMFDAGDAGFERIDRKVWWLRIGFFLALPASLMTYGNPVASGLGQCIFAWTMIFGLIRLFRIRFSSENRTVRYLSDSSYWLYLAHLPLVVAAQLWIRNWNLPSGIKFPGLTLVTTALLLASYQILVRNTWIGRLLNGPRRSQSISSNPGS